MSVFDNPSDPFDPYCKTFARNMPYLDMHRDPDEETRAEYIITEEGTYNPQNGHFACDACYIKIGMPTAPSGWVAP